MPKSDIQLNEATHIYTLDKVVIPSVSQVLKIAGLKDISKFCAPEDLIRGTYVHKAISLYETGNLDESTVDPLIKPYFDAYLKFRKETDYKPMASEQKVYSTRYRYAGRLDSERMFKEKFMIVDYTTGSEFHPADAIQVEAYKEARNETIQDRKLKAKDRLIVRLDKEGSYYLPPEKFYGKNDFNVFLACLTIYNCKKAWGVLNGKDKS